MTHSLSLAALTVLFVSTTALGQQATLSSPVVTTGDRFFESFNVNWGFQSGSGNGGMFFRFGNPNGAIPPFGGFNPQSANRLNFATRGNGGRAFFNFSAAQGSQRNVQSSVPSVTVMNGALGSWQNTTIRPFVIGSVPVVRGRVTSPVVERLERLKSEQPIRPDQHQVVRRPVAKARVYPSRRRAARSTAETTDLSVAKIKALRSSSK